jgi:pimeloyl-ACP methyl ester carboxylesterase
VCPSVVFAKPGRDGAAALVADDLSAIKNPAALSFRQFAESRAADLHALAAFCRSGWFPTPEGLEIALGQVRVPLLAVVGGKDGNLAAVQRLSKTVPNAQLVILPGEDHFSATPAQSYKEAVASFLDTSAASVA